MNGLQKHVLQLMKEIDEACAKQGIPYILYGSTAAWANRRKKFLGNQGTMEVLVPAGYFPKLRQALTSAGRANRAVEDLSSNPKLAYNIMRYVDTDTTFFDRRDKVRYEHFGVAITIRPAFSSALKGLARAVETTLPYLHGGEPFNKCRMSDARAKTYNTMEKIEGIFGPRLIASYCYGHLKKDKPSNSGKLFYVVDPQTVVSIDAKELFEAARINFEGASLPVAKNIAAYLKRHYGHTWKAKGSERPGLCSRITIMCYDDLPYREAIALTKAEGVDLYELKERMYREFMHTCTVIRPLYSRADDSYQIADMSRARIDLFLEYEPLRDELRKASKASDVDALASMLSEYLSESVRFMDEEHQGLYIDDELLGFADQVWKAQGKTGYAELIRKTAPQAFKERSLRDYLKDYL